MDRDHSKRNIFTSIIFASIVVLPAVTSMVVLTIRVGSLFQPPARYMQTTGGEPISIQNVLKLQCGLPLYQDPRDPPYYPTTLYNVGFYYFYALWTGPFRFEPGLRIAAMRMVTLTLAIALLVAMVGFVCRQWNRRAPVQHGALASLAIASMIVTTLLGQLMGWWLVTVRPDVGGAVFAGFALLVLLGREVKSPRLAPLLAGCCLAAAWSFKQSMILIAVGLVLSALMRRRYLSAALLLIPPCLAVFGCVAALGPDYLANVAWATSLPSFGWSNLARMSLTLAAKGTLPLALSAAGIAWLRRAAWLRPDERLTLMCCWLTTLVGGWVACFRDGADANYFFELWVVVGLLAVLATRLLFDQLGADGTTPRVRWAAPLVGLLCFVSAGLDVARLAGLAEGRLGNLRLTLDREAMAELDRVGLLMRTNGGDNYCQPALWGLGLNSSLPTPNFDDYGFFHKVAAKRGLLRGDGLDGLMAQHHFPLIVLDIHNNRMLAAATAAGYIRQPGWRRIIVLEAPASQRFHQVNRGPGRPSPLSVRAN
jgi:hypothetical protein